MAEQTPTLADDPTTEEWNWARTHRFTARQVERPSSVDHIGAIVTTANGAGHTVRAAGSRHSFTSIADADVLLDLTNMPERFDLSLDQSHATVNGSMIYSRLAELLLPTSRAVQNLASLPHISIAGATATGTHGSGDSNGNLATSIRAIEYVDPTGSLRRTERGDPDFAVAPISLGALGIIVSVELDVVPEFHVRQFVHNSLSWDVVLQHFDRIFASAYSVSVFTNWADHLQLWTKERIDDDAVDHASLHDGVPAVDRHHPIPGVDADACTEQGGQPGRWNERLPHFRAGAVPSVGAEVQSEFFVDRAHAVDAVAALHSVGPQLATHLMAGEIRTVQADDLWLSPQHHRDCVGFHFTWRHDIQAAHHAARLVANALAPFHPLPHWGKVFDPRQFDFAELYPRLVHARDLFASADPTGVFRNAWMTTTFG